MFDRTVGVTGQSVEIHESFFTLVGLAGRLSVTKLRTEVGCLPHQRIKAAELEQIGRDSHYVAHDLMVCFIRSTRRLGVKNDENNECDVTGNNPPVSGSPLRQ